MRLHHPPIAPNCSSPMHWVWFGGICQGKVTPGTTAQRNSPGTGRRKSITWSVVDTVKYIADSLSGKKSSKSAADIAAAAVAAAAAEPRGSILRRGSHTAGDPIIDMLKDENLDLTDVIIAAELEADSRTTQAIEAAAAMRRAFGHRGKASVIVITNRSAAKLDLCLTRTQDKVKSEIGYVYERSTVPLSIGPGKAASFLHVTDWNTSKVSRGSLTYRIDVFTKEGWADSGEYLAFQWDSNKKAKSNAHFTSSGSVKHISSTGTRYDGTKISGTVTNKETSKQPVYEFSFSHAKIDEGHARVHAHNSRGDVEGKGGGLGEDDSEAVAKRKSRCIVM